MGKVPGLLAALALEQPLEMYQARFGHGLPDRALEPGVLRAIFRPDVN